MKEIVIAGGCFWGLQELFRHQVGVTDTVVGYTGGQNSNPTYDYHPGHAEALKITYNPAETSADALLDYLFRIHDPTTLNRQGNDIGESYRSTIFVGTDSDRVIAQQAINRAQRNWSAPIVTTIEPLATFYEAEPEHQDYLQKHPGGYTCHYERDF